MENLASLPENERNAVLAQFTEEEAEALLYDWATIARPDQLEPEGNWDIWLALAGRGWGKTRTGAEWVRKQVEAKSASRIALIAETYKDALEVMIEGDSGLLNVFPPDQRPVYTKKPLKVEFHTGAVALGYNATEPDQLRGPQFDLAWCDELAKWKYARETWDMLQFGLRLGTHPKVLVTTTPRPIELVKSIVAGEEGKVHVTKGRTLDNRGNLAAPFMAKVLKKYEGTRLGRQELNAEILGDLPGAIWTQRAIDSYRIEAKDLPTITRKVVAVAPAVTSDDSSEDPGTHGIVVAGIDADQTGYTLKDESLQGTPYEWASHAASLYKTEGADAVVVETNQGGDMVVHTLRTVAPNINIITVRASRGKHVRAEPVAAMYEQGRIRHVGQFPDMEQQMTQFTTDGYQGEGSPDRVDALVWAMTELFPDMVEATPDVSRFMKRGRSRGWQGA